MIILVITSMWSYNQDETHAITILIQWWENMIGSSCLDRVAAKAANAFLIIFSTVQRPSLNFIASKEKAKDRRKVVQKIRIMKIFIVVMLVTTMLLAIKLVVMIMMT